MCFVLCFVFLSRLSLKGLAAGLDVFAGSRGWLGFPGRFGFGHVSQCHYTRAWKKNQGLCSILINRGLPQP